MSSRDPSPESLALSFDCDAERGRLIWKHRPWVRSVTNTRFAGKLAGHASARGYVQVRMDEALHPAHRLIWIMTHGPIAATLQIDHINGNPADNRIGNLRLATNAENARNGKVRVTNKSGCKGAAFHPFSGLWAARITVSGQWMHLGYFKTPEAAHEVYVRAAQKYFGEFARVG